MSVFDDSQAMSLAALQSHQVCGKRMYRITRSRDMEDLSYDLHMPIDPPLPEPAWRSIIEPEPPPEIPSAPAPITGLFEACEAAGLSRPAAGVVLGLLGLLFVEKKA